MCGKHDDPSMVDELWREDLESLADRIDDLSTQVEELLFMAPKESEEKLIEAKKFLSEAENSVRFLL